jgi:hypothetical protein
MALESIVVDKAHDDKRPAISLQEMQEMLRHGARYVRPHTLVA